MGSPRNVKCHDQQTLKNVDCLSDFYICECEFANWYASKCFFKNWVGKGKNIQVPRVGQLESADIFNWNCCNKCCVLCLIEFPLQFETLLFTRAQIGTLGARACLPARPHCHPQISTKMSPKTISQTTALYSYTNILSSPARQHKKKKT